MSRKLVSTEERGIAVLNHREPKPLQKRCGHGLRIGINSSRGTWIKGRCLTRSTRIRSEAKQGL